MRTVFRKKICEKTIFDLYQQNEHEPVFIKRVTLDGYWTRAKAEKEILCGDYAQNHFIVHIRNLMQEYVYDSEVIRKYGKAVKYESN